MTNSGLILGLILFCITMRFFSFRMKTRSSVLTSMHCGPIEFFEFVMRWGFWENFEVSCCLVCCLVRCSQVVLVKS